MTVDPYKAPEEPVEAEDLEAQHGSSPLVTAAGFASAAAGIMMLATAWQLSSMLYFLYAWQEGWVYSIGLFGAGALVGGAGYTQARGWSIHITLLSTVLGALASWSWAAYALVNGGFNLINIVGAGGATGAAMLVGLSMGMAQRIVRARAALFADLDD